LFVAAFFSIQASRGKKVLRGMMGDFKGIIISDQYAAYNILNGISHFQLLEI